MFNENPKEETVIAMRNREIRLNREGEYWTDEEQEQLRTIFEAGFGITKIAYILCRTEPAVYQQIESMDLYNRKANPQRRRSAAKPRGCLCENCLCDSSFCPRCMKEQDSEEAVANVRRICRHLDGRGVL